MRALLFAAVVLGCVFVIERPAEACGGCFAPSQTVTVVTDHRMILTLSSTETTLYDQIRYSGNPASFAWVLPISGVANVGLSADIVFATLDTMTATVVQAPPRSCPSPPNCGNDFGGSADAAFSGALDSGSPVQVLKDEVVGPYETVQLATQDPGALNTWLTAHGFNIPSDTQPIIDAYVSEGFNFLALKLVPGASIQSMRPVRVTTQGAAPVLPLRMVAAGVGSTVGITLWVLAEGRYEPQNFPFFHIEDKELVWDWKVQSSNYAALRQEKQTASKNSAWEIESSITLSAENFERVVRAGGSPYYGWDQDAAADYTPVNAPDGGDGGKTAGDVRDEDLKVLFAGLTNPRATRLRTDLARASLGVDLQIQASGDQSTLSNRRIAGSAIWVPPCPTFTPCQNDLSAFGGCACDAAGRGPDVITLGIAGVFVLFRWRRRAKR